MAACSEGAAAKESIEKYKAVYGVVKIFAARGVRRVVEWWRRKGELQAAVGGMNRKERKSSKKKCKRKEFEAPTDMSHSFR